MKVRANVAAVAAVIFLLLFVVTSFAKISLNDKQEPGVKITPYDNQTLEVQIAWAPQPGERGGTAAILVPYRDGIPMKGRLIVILTDPCGGAIASGKLIDMGVDFQDFASAGVAFYDFIILRPECSGEYVVSAALLVPMDKPLTGVATFNY